MLPNISGFIPGEEVGKKFANNEVAWVPAANQAVIVK
jgi:hypothetical protein